MDQLPERLSDLVSEPVFPDAAREFTTDGAAAFSQYVVDAVNWAYATGDSSFLLNHCAEDSGFCAGVRDDATMMVTDGRVRHGGMLSYAIDTVELYPNEDDAFVVGVTTVTATVDLDSDGRALTETDERELDVTMQMAFSDGGWTLLLAGGG